MDEPQTNSDVESLSFEQALARLESIVQELEDGRSGLNDALTHYEEGVRLLKHCHVTLSQVERKISLLTGVEADGTAITESFDEESMTLQEKQDSRSRRRSLPKPQAASPKQATRKPASRSPDASQSDMDIQGGLF